MANAQPNTQASCSQPCSPEPSSTNGNAYSRLKVAALPRKCTGSEEKPRVLSSGTRQRDHDIASTTMTTSHQGMISRSARPISTARM